MKKDYLKNLALPLLVAAYPVLFLYAHNALILPTGSLVLPLVGAVLVALAVFGLYFQFDWNPLAASLSASVFMLFFYLYGFIYRWLLQLDIVHIEHFVVLPLVIVLGVYVGYFVRFIKRPAAVAIQNVVLVVAAVLVVFNMTLAVPAEAKKIQAKSQQKQSARPTAAASANAAATAIPGSPSAVSAAASGQKKPDIYYIILDEYVRFDAMRDYWHNNDVDQFQNFLEQHHFFVATQSRTPTINTGTEMASRLNLHQYQESDDQNVVMNALNNNKVMQILKSYGYTNVVLNMAFPDINADYNFSFDPQQVSGMASDQFRQTFINDTMFAAFNSLIEANDPAAVKQRDLINYALEKTTDLKEIQSPKFVYTHLLLPHTPFIFDKDGNLLPPQAAEDWHYYLGQYQYATKVTEQLIAKLLADADPDNPPVIIIQSDEGARNLKTRSPNNVIINGYLENYPEEYFHDILNTLYLPGFDTSTLPSDLPPIQTFPLVLNYYLHANIAVDNK